MMEIFVNECSLHEQLHERDEFILGFRKFFTILSLFNQRKAAYTLYQHENLFTMYRITETESLIASLNKLPDKALSQGIKSLLFNRLNVKDWQTSRKHSSEDVFLCLEEIVTDTSMAELAERKLQDTELIGVLINFAQSKFHQLTSVEVAKNDLPSLLIDCLDDHHIVNKWLDDKLQRERFDYDYASNVTPTDLQTILREHQRFTSTTYFVDGRRVYKEVATECYWYVDNLHYGRAAHLEVFTRNGLHFGEADLAGAVDPSKSDPRKKLNL